MKDKITWRIIPQTLKTDARAKALERAILEDCPVEEVSRVRTFTLLLSCTKGIEFDTARARPALQSFKQFIEHDAVTMQGAELWNYCEDLHLNLWHAWISGFNDGQELFETDPAELPTSALTDAQKAELAQSDSPLA
jgi:hypothetical protein